MKRRPHHPFLNRPHSCLAPAYTSGWYKQKSREDHMTESHNEPDSRLRVLVVTAGHSFEAEPFFAMFDADSGIRWEGAEQPEAMALFGADKVGTWDAIVMYDMPGIKFVDGESVLIDPPEYFQRRFL